MSVAEWNVNDYKTDYESEEHWELRKKFMETYKDKFPEDELVCLAQVFVNVEFMGCKYPDETMKLVGELSQEVAGDFRKERAGRLKRTFVRASDAAEQKAKGKRLKNANTSNTFNITAILKNTKISDNSDSEEDNERPSFSGVNKNYENPRLINNYWSSLTMKQNIRDDDDAYKFFQISEVSDYNEQSKNYNNALFSGLRYQNFILMITGDRNSIHTSATKCSCKYEEKERVNENGEKICEISLNGKSVSIGKGPSGKIARKLAFDEAMKVLQTECYSVKTKSNPEKINISRTNETITAKVEISSEFSRLDSNNIGYKMMQKLGWTGGALGVRTKGREEPIDCLTIKNNRKGLGNETDEINANYFKKLLKSYTASDDIRELHFDSCFTKEDRAKLHQIATSKNLKSTSYGKGIERYLVVSKRTISPESIVKEVLINKNPMYINKYEVRVPICKRRDFPDHNFEIDLLRDDN